MKPYMQVKGRLLRNRATLKVYEEIGPEFALVQAIIEKRIAKGMTQATLARKMGTKQSAIARLESGAHNPSLDFLEKTAKALDARLVISFS